jgi:hypothetical protein
VDDGCISLVSRLFAQINWLMVSLLVTLTEEHGWRQARLIVVMFHACGSRHAVAQTCGTVFYARRQIPLS